MGYRQLNFLSPEKIWIWLLDVFDAFENKDELVLKKQSRNDFLIHQ